VIEESAKCVFVFPHEPHTLHVRGVAVGTCTGREPMEETTVIEDNPYDPFDALRFAVDLHANRYRLHDVTAEGVLADAEAFLTWLREKSEQQ